MCGRRDGFVERTGLKCNLSSPAVIGQTALVKRKLFHLAALLLGAFVFSHPRPRTGPQCAWLHLPSHMIIPHPLSRSVRLLQSYHNITHQVPAAGPRLTPSARPGQGEELISSPSNLDISLHQPPVQDRCGRFKHKQRPVPDKQPKRPGRDWVSPGCLSSSDVPTQAIWKHLLPRPPKTRTIPCCETLDAGC
ncbi:hypothetical protein CCMA1212_007345 [Trichoderma ghanense]|uniref:Uncharacterized protein n=1 Tax=Trichoderma ghanense TaxID=65468 RepID=A0ABY2H0J0_9HYPO